MVELTSKFHPDGGHFLVKEYPKDKEHRQVSISPEPDTRLRDYIKRRVLGPDDLIFRLDAADVGGLRELVPAPTPEEKKEFEFVRPNGKTKTYRHGTLTGYVAGQRRCDVCKAEFAVYRRGRRAEGKDTVPGRRTRRLDTDGHIPRRWFREFVWIPARDAAGLGVGAKPHGMRHAHASWLLAGGADIARVKERLGHSSILTTQKYLHTLPDLEKDPALDAFAKIRNRFKVSAASWSKGRST